MNSDHRVDYVLNCLTLSRETDYIGEPVSQLEHALQCAFFAMESGHSNDVILASLFHDIGHFASPFPQIKMDNLGVIYHEWIGAKLVYEMGFSKKIALLIGHHVNAKRYLAYKKDNYYSRLSDASKKTLDFQGGPMSNDESIEFEQHIYFREILQIRINDEKGKVVGLEVPELECYRNLITNNLKISQNFNDKILLTKFIDKSWIKQFKEFLEIY